MSIINDILLEEKNRLIYLLDQHNKEIESLPVGSIVYKKRNGKYYAYLTYRKGKSVKTDYLGKIKSDRVKSLDNDIQKRKKIENLIKKVSANLDEINEALNGVIRHAKKHST